MINNHSPSRYYPTKIKLWIAVVFLFFPSIILGCGGQTNYMWDYYEAYKFVIPFEYKTSTNVGYLAINSNLSLSQIKDELSKKYEVQLHNSLFYMDGIVAEDDEMKNIDSLLIIAKKNQYNHYFLMYDKRVWFEQTINNEEQKIAYFSMVSMSYPFSIDNGNRYNILFPKHFLITELPYGTPRNSQITCTFEELVDFYQNTNRKTIVDYDKQTIIFAGRDSEGRRKKFLGCTISTDYPSVDIQMTYTTNDDGQNFVHFDVIK